MILAQHPDQPRRKHKVLGYWSEDVNPCDYVDESWDEEQRNAVILYLDSYDSLYWWRGSSRCRFCDIRNGSRCQSDGTYVWPSGFSHYLLEHGVKPPQEFILHVERAG